jgi:hypothetical protein
MFIVTFTCCKSTSQQKKSDYSDRFNMVIEDYYQKNREDFDNYKIFSLQYKPMLNKEYYFYSILPMRDKNYIYTIDEDPELSYLPSGYIKFKGKVFFIEDNDVVDTDPVLLQYIDSLQLLDSTKIKLQLGLIKPEDVELKSFLSDDSLEGVDYIICKDKPYEICKSIRSSSYIPPDSEKFENLCK